jgi:predicted phosphoribosyltransferase
MVRFRDRHEAGVRLAAELPEYAGRDDVYVLALPRGGVPVGYEVATALGLPLDVFVVRKLGVPGHEELAMGAIASGGVRIINGDVVHQFGVTDDVIATTAAHEQVELERRERRYRDGRSLPDVRYRTVILVDDGLATGSSMIAAATALRAHEPARIVVAVPVAAADSCAALREIADDVICAVTPVFFEAVGAWYDDFTQVTDDEVHDLLTRASAAYGRVGR